MANAGVRGRPIAPLALSSTGTGVSGETSSAPPCCSVVIRAMPHHSAMCGRFGEQGCCCGAQAPRTHGWQMALSMCRRKNAGMIVSSSVTEGRRSGRWGRTLPIRRISALCSPGRGPFFQARRHWCMQSRQCCR